MLTERHHLSIEAPRKRRIKHRPEQMLHIATAAMLRVILPRGAFFLHFPAGGFRSPVEAAILKGMGVLAGVPDLIIGYGGRGFGIELKTDKTDLSAAQREMHHTMRAAGWRVEVARSVDEVVRILDEFGIPLRLAESDPMLLKARRAA